MASKHPSDAIFNKFPDVSSESLTVDDSLAVQKALGTERIINIGRALGLSTERVDDIKKLHHHSPSRQAIAIVDTWLRGNFSDQRPPYTIPGNTPHPSWRSLVWAVAHNVGGNNPAKANIIAQKSKEYQRINPEPKYEKISTEKFNEGQGKEIAARLERVWSRWYEIGFGLKVPTEVLDEIEVGDGYFRDKMARMIDVWIRVFAVADEPPCWRQLVEAVAASYGGQNQVLAETLAQDLEIATDAGVITDERAQQIIDQGLKSSRVKQRQVVTVITGLMGSGKTTLLSRLFNRPPPDIYTSTGLAEQSFRGLLHHIGHMAGGSWKLLSHKDIREFLAPLFLAGMTEADMASLTANLMRAMAPPDTTTSHALPSPASPSMETSPEAAPQSSPPSESLSLPEKSPTSQAMVSLVKSTTSSTEELILEIVNMIDTGGQPELIEVLSSFIHNADLAVVVINLMFRLSQHPPINYHEKGIAYNRKLSSQYTGREIILKLASTLQAKKSSRKTGSLFRLLVVATHRDCVEGDREARVATLNQELRSLLLPAFKEELILSKTPDKIAFVLNLKNPDDTDVKVLALIREKIGERGLGEIFEVPGSFFMFEQDLIHRASKVGRGILSLQECMQVGARLQMDGEMVQAALVLFHRQNTFLYFRHVLPNHVFVKPQVPLDCVNSIVRFSYRVGSGEMEGLPAKFVPLLTDGIITEEMLSHKELSSLFIPGLYQPSHAIKLLLHTLNIAPLSHDVQQSQATEEASTVPSIPSDEYLMMCLLPPVPEQELPHCIPSSSDTVPLVVKFSNNCVPLGCFSSTISCLLSTHGWKVSRKAGGRPERLAHNIVSLNDPELPVTITALDRASQIEFHLNCDEEDRDILPEICSKIFETVFGAVHKAFDVMRLTEIEVSPAVLCPCSDETVAHSACHYTAMKRDYLRCSKTGASVGRATPQHMMWLCNKLATTTNSETPSPLYPYQVLDDQFPGVCFLGEPQEVAIQSKPVTISPPGLGVTLKIPPNAVQSSTVSLRACLSSTVFQYPEGCTPLSAVYHISSNSAFDKHIELTIEHFADLETGKQANEMTFFRAESGEKGKYSFTPMEGGVFKVGGHRCTISTRLVPSFVCAGSIPSSEIRERYAVLCSYSNNIEDVRHVAVAISLDDAVFITNFRKALEEEWKLPLSHRSKPNVFFKESSALVSYHQTNLKEWSVTSDASVMALSQEDVDYPSTFNYPPRIISDIKPLKKAKPSTLQLALTGLTERCDFLVSLTLSKSVEEAAKKPRLVNLTTLGEGDINIIQRSAVRCRQIGNILLNDRYGDRFDYGDREKAMDIVGEVYEAWLAEDPNCSWVTLTDCFRQCGLHSLARAIEQHFGLPSPLLDTEVLEVDIKLYERAMTQGSIKAALAILIFVGVTGSGKSLFQKLVLDLRVPEFSPSTPLAKSSVRSMSICQAAVGGGDKQVEWKNEEVKWKIVTPADMWNIVAENAAAFKAKQERLKQVTKTQVRTKGDEHKSTQKQSQEKANSSQSKKVVTDAVPDGDQEKANMSKQKNPDASAGQIIAKPNEQEPTDETGNTTLHMKCIQALKTLDFDGDLVRQMKAVSGNVMDVDFIYILDSGGQPPFRELLPHVVQQASGIVLLQRLNERLDFRPTITYREEGVKDEGYFSPLTNEQILHQYFQAVQSHDSTVFVIGTHRDREHECEEESRADKNKRLLKAFRPVLGNRIALYATGDPDQLIFPVDNTSRGPEDLKTAGDFRKSVVYHCMGGKKEIPLSWFMLEQLLQQLAKEMKVTVLSKEECYMAAYTLNMSNDMCEEAMKYLHNLNIIFYRPDIIENAVFCSAQVVLDKLTEIVHCSHRMHTNTGTENIPSCMKSTEGLKFRDYAQVDPELLGKAFPSHYRESDNVFTASDFLRLSECLLIAGKPKNTPYFIPNVLPDLSLQKVAKHRVTSTDHPPPITIYYPKMWLPVGVVPALVVYLINHWGWTPVSEGGKPVCMCHNCMQFELPEGEPGSVTLIDSIKFLEIHIKQSLPDSQVCPRIMEMLLSGLEAAHKSLHYDPPAAVEGMLCPCKCGVKDGHYANVDKKKGFWTCSENRTIGGKWPCSSSEQKNDITNKPDLLNVMEFKKCDGGKINILEKIGGDYEDFGIRLLNDGEGNIMSEIKINCGGEAKAIKREIIRKWISGTGKEPISWETLAGVLGDMGHTVLAQDIRQGTQAETRRQVETKSSLLVTSSPPITTARPPPIISPPPSRMSEQPTLDSTPPTITPSPPPTTPPPPSRMSERPTLPQLLCLRVPQTVGPHYSTFGILLLNDTTGSRVAAFYQGDADNVMLRILREWLEGRGLPVSWETLVKTLRDTGLSALADEIQQKLTTH